MNPAALKFLLMIRRHRLGWRFWTGSSVALIFLATVGTSCRWRNPQPEVRSHEPAALPTFPPGMQLLFIPAPSSYVELKGTATIGSWTSRSSDIHGKVALDLDANALNTLFDRIQLVTENDRTDLVPLLSGMKARTPPVGAVSLPVMSLQGDSAGMDHDMQNALKVDAHPFIEYEFRQLRQATVQWNPADHRAELKLQIAGTLTMAGVQRPITMDVIVNRDFAGHFLARAQTALLMSDFDVKPPVALFGLIKASEKVNVIFNLDFILSARSPGG